MLKPLIHRLSCKHEQWYDLDSYENNLPKNSLLCGDCGLIKNK